MSYKCKNGKRDTAGLIFRIGKQEINCLEQMVSVERESLKGIVYFRIYNAKLFYVFEKNTKKYKQDNRNV